MTKERYFDYHPCDEQQSSDHQKLPASQYDGWRIHKNAKKAVEYLASNGLLKGVSPKKAEQNLLLIWSGKRPKGQGGQAILNIFDKIIDRSPAK